MLVPAILYKDEIEKQFAKRMYDDDMFYYQGYGHGHEMKEIEPQDNVYQWAIMGKPKTYKEYHSRSGTLIVDEMPILIGYFAYKIDPVTDNVYNFGLYSFDKGNMTFLCDVLKKMEELINTHHRIEWRCVGGNPAFRGCNRFAINVASKYPYWIVNLHQMHDVTKDNKGEYHDEYIFEIVKR